LGTTWYGLFDGEQKVGGVTPSDGRNFLRDVAIDLPEELPLEGQVFLMWLLIWKWGAPST
jgi:hypothetical protein